MVVRVQQLATNENHDSKCRQQEAQAPDFGECNILESEPVYSRDDMQYCCFGGLLSFLSAESESPCATADQVVVVDSCLVATGAVTGSPCRVVNEIPLSP